MLKCTILYLFIRLRHCTALVTIGRRLLSFHHGGEGTVCAQTTSYPGCVAFAWDRVDYRVSTLVLDVVKETNLKAPVYKATPLHYINLMLGGRLLEMGRVLEWGLSDRSRYRRLDKNS